MKVRPTPPPRTPATVRRRVTRAAIGAGAVAAGLIVACGGKTSGDDDNKNVVAPQAPPQGVSPQPCTKCVPPQLPPQVTPQPPQVSPQPPQPDSGVLDADVDDAEDAG
jgi:hypothetical protein